MTHQPRSLLARTAAVLAGAALTAGLATAVVSSPASAAPCAGATAPRLVGSVPGAALEGLTVDASGRLYATDLISGQVLSLIHISEPTRPY